MTKQEIINALNPSWWTAQSSLWNTDFLTAIISFNTQDLDNCQYTSSAPYQTNGLNAGESGIDQSVLVRDLITAAAQRLFDMHATGINGNLSVGYVYNAGN